MGSGARRQDRRSAEGSTGRLKATHACPSSCNAATGSAARRHPGGEPDWTRRGLRLRREGLILPLETLIQRAMERYPGARLLEAELEEEDDLYVYEIELLTTRALPASWSSMLAMAA